MATFTLDTPGPITVTTPKLTFSFDSGGLDNLYPAWLSLAFNRVEKGPHGEDDFSFPWGGGYPYTVGTPGYVPTSGTWEVPFADADVDVVPGTYRARFMRNVKVGKRYEPQDIATAIDIIVT